MGQPHLAREEVKSFETVRAEAAVYSKGELACLWKDFDSSWQRTAATQRSLMSLYKELAVVAAIASDLWSANARLRKELETTSSTHVEVKTGLDENLGEARDALGQKTGERNALVAKVGELEKGLASLHSGPRVTDKKRQRLELQVALDANTIAHLASLVQNHTLNFYLVTAETAS